MIVKELEDVIKIASQAYYGSGEAIMTDREFDDLVERLKNLDPDNELLKKVGFGFEPNGKLRKVFHEYPMYTIDSKHKDLENIDIFISGYGPYNYILIQPKYDGVSATAYVKNGKVTKVVTRGDGEKGFDITDKVNIEYLVETKYPKLTGYVRMEICMSKLNYSKYYDPKVNPSPRNLVAGIVNKLKPEDWELRILEPVVLDVVSMPECKIISYHKSIQIEAGKLPETPYGTDGYVIKAINPEGRMIAICAYKPIGESAETTVRSIEWQLGQTGKYTPVLNIDTITLSGANISRVTGNSYRMMKELGTGVGARVEIIRSGEVIPKIENVLERSDILNLPDNIDIIGAHIYDKSHEVDTRERLISSLTWTKGFGWNLRTLLLEQMPEEISQFDIVEWLDDLKGLTDHQRSLVDKALNELHRRSYIDFIDSMNLPNLGRSNITKILQNQRPNKLAEETWCRYQNNIRELAISLGIDTEFKAEEPKEFKGKIAITGKFDKPRKEIEQEIISLGFEPTDSVKSDTSYLLISDLNSTSSKAKKARELGIKLIQSVDDIV